MIKKVITFCIIIAIIILFFAFYTENTYPLHKEAGIEEVTAFMYKSESQFLSDEYFYEIDSLFEQIEKKMGIGIFMIAQRKLRQKLLLIK